MIYTKAQKLYDKYYPRKDRRVNSLGIKYKTWFHYGNGYNVKIFRKESNRRLRRFKGDVSDHCWYKRFDEVWYLLY